MFNENSSPFLQSRSGSVRRRSLSSHKSINTPLHPDSKASPLDRRSSRVVWRSHQLARTHSRIVHGLETFAKEAKSVVGDESQTAIQMTPLKSRPNIRVIHFNSLDGLEDSPDRLATEDSEIYKEYTRMPVNKENQGKIAPTSLMNELILFMSPKAPIKRPNIKSRVRIRPLLYVP